MKKAIMAILLLPMLSGCALALGEVAIARIGVGIAAEAATGAEAAMATTRVLITEDVAAAARGIRLNTAVRGTLSESFSNLTNGGRSRAAVLVAENGSITANNYVVARISITDGMIYSPEGPA